MITLNDEDGKIVSLSRDFFPLSVSTGCCFVSCNVRLNVAFYPNVRPRFELTQSCGILDEGKSISMNIRRLIQESSPGEPILFEIFQEVLNCLELVNDGECLICGDSLRPPLSCSIAPESYSLKTWCGHCYHVTCLARWSSISLSQRCQLKAVKAANERDHLLVRTCEGELNGSVAESLRLEASLCELQVQDDIWIQQLQELCLSIDNSKKSSGRILVSSASAKAARDREKEMAICDADVKQLESCLGKSKSTRLVLTEKLQRLKKR